jgi:hypothetical protein
MRVVSSSREEAMERLSRVVLVAALVAACALPAGAQRPSPRPDTLLERMAGSWVLSGTIDGQRTTHDVVAEWVLGREYLRLSEASRERTSAGGPAYEAIVFLGIDPVKPGLACLWLDNTGPTGLNGKGLAHADPSRGDSIAFVFFPGSATEFHTAFVYERAVDRWQWHMDGMGKDGKAQPFARLTMTRAGRTP